MHIGLIGGIGPAATEFYYRGLVRTHAAADRSMELTIAHADMRDLLRTFPIDARQEQAELFFAYVRRLQAAGAEAVAITSMTGHFCVQELNAISPLPIIDAIPVLDAYLMKQQFKRVGLLGTRVVMETKLYGGMSSVELTLPQGRDLDAVHDAYIAMATAGVASDDQRALMFSVGQKLCREQGAETILLGGTDLFLAFDGHACGFPVTDCAEVHVEALFAASVGGLT